MSRKTAWYGSTFQNQNVTGYVSSTFKGKNGMYKAKDKTVGKLISEPLDMNAAFAKLMHETSKPSRTRETLTNFKKQAVKPLDRFKKLKDSLVDFQGELKSVIDNSLPNSADRLICDALLTQVNGIVVKLDELTKHPTYGGILKPSGAETLPTSMVLESLKKCTEPLSTAAESEGEQTFTIYSKVGGGMDNTFCKALDMEARVAHLENDVLGDCMSKEIPFPDLMQAIKFLHKRITTVWSVYRQGQPPLSDMLRSLNEKLTNTHGGLGGYHHSHTKDYLKGNVLEPAEDPNNKKVDALYKKFKKGNEKLDLLRSTVRRIDNLGVVHVCLAKLVDRVNSAVDEHAEVMNSISSYRKTLRDTDENLKRNEKQMLQNFEAVSKRCARLE